MLLPLILAAVYLLTLPGVGDAEARVEALLAQEGGRALPVPPPARLGAAVVSTEDENFYANPVIDLGAGVGRAALAAVGTSEDPGGSTIAQQLAKRLYPHGGGFLGTLEEVGLGVKLSLSYSHEQVLSMYLNAVYYGNGYWGDYAAAEGYFGVSPRRLTWGEAAMLAGLPQAPSAYDPDIHPRLARLRQRHVLDQLVANGHLTRAGAEAAFRESLPLATLTARRCSAPQRPERGANLRRVGLGPFPGGEVTAALGFRPVVRINGWASGWGERTWRKWTERPSISVRNWPRSFSRRSVARQS